MVALEGEKSQVEGVTPTAEEKVVVPTELQEKPTVSITDTEDFKKALDKALGKSLESINRQASTSRAQTAVEKARADKLQGDVDDLAREVERLAMERFGDDPEALAGYKKTRNIELKEKQLSLKEAELEGLRWAITMNNVADEIIRENPDVPRKVLENCTSEEQMRAIAEAFPKVGAKEGQEEKPPPKFASGVSSGVGVDLNSLSSTELIQRGVSRMLSK